MEIGMVSITSLKSAAISNTHTITKPTSAKLFSLQPSP